MKNFTSFGHSIQLSAACSRKFGSLLLNVCWYFVFALHVKCCSVPIHYLFHSSIKFYKIKFYANGCKIMQLEVETSCVHHLNMCSHRALCANSIWSKSMILPMTPKHLDLVPVPFKAAPPLNPSSDSCMFYLLQQAPNKFDCIQLLSY